MPITWKAPEVLEARPGYSRTVKEGEVTHGQYRATETNQSEQLEYGVRPYSREIVEYRPRGAEQWVRVADSDTDPDPEAKAQVHAGRYAGPSHDRFGGK